MNRITVDRVQAAYQQTVAQVRQRRFCIAGMNTCCPFVRVAA